MRARDCSNACEPRSTAPPRSSAPTPAAARPRSSPTSFDPPALPFVWYQIDPSDLDLAVFFGYLIYGIRNSAAEFGQVALGFISETEDLAKKTDQLVDVFVNEVSEQVEEKTIVVLDDYHHVDSSEPIAAAVDRLLQYLPDVLHIVITSRSMPNLSVTRLRSKGLVGVVDRQDLLFTQERCSSYSLRLSASRFRSIR